MVEIWPQIHAPTIPAVSRTSQPGVPRPPAVLACGADAAKLGAKDVAGDAPKDKAKPDSMNGG